MRNLDQRHRVGGYSLPEISRGMGIAALQLDALGLELNGRKVQPGPLASALCLWWLKLPQTERARIAKIGLAELEVLMNSDEPIEWDPRDEQARPPSAPEIGPKNPRKRG